MSPIRHSEHVSRGLQAQGASPCLSREKRLCVRHLPVTLLSMHFICYLNGQKVEFVGRKLAFFSLQINHFLCITVFYSIKNCEGGASTGVGVFNIGRLGDEVITRDSLRCAAEWILHRARKNSCKSSCQVIVIVV